MQISYDDVIIKKEMFTQEPEQREYMGNCCSVTTESCAVTQTSNTDTEEDYVCPICQDIYRLPVRITRCRHVFCKTCLETAVQSLGPRCPVCRTFVSKRPKRATDVQERMREKKGKCRACGNETLLSKIRLHYESCNKYKKEYGLITDPAPPTSAQTQDNTGFIPSIPLPTSRIRAVLGAEVHQPHTELQRQSGQHEIVLHQPNAAPQIQRGMCLQSRERVLVSILPPGGTERHFTGSALHNPTCRTSQPSCKTHSIYTEILHQTHISRRRE
ncbi:hypothetical protein MHYP_G00014620 [Metynnis hypsauchen]